MHKKAANALKKVQSELEKKGLSLKIWDGYRPLSAQQKFWDLVQDERYVSNPAINKGRHTRGTAIDLTLVKKNKHSDGSTSYDELDMPTLFDDFSERAFSTATKGISNKQQANRKLLHEIMIRHGFENYEFEWWHFDWAGWKNDEKYPALDIAFEHLENATPQA